MKPTYETAVIENQKTIKDYVTNAIQDKNNIDDVVQDTLLAAHQHWDKFDETKTSAKNWFLHLAKQIVIKDNAKNKNQGPEMGD